MKFIVNFLYGVFNKSSLDNGVYNRLTNLILNLFNEHIVSLSVGPAFIEFHLLVIILNFLLGATEADAKFLRLVVVNSFNATQSFLWIDFIDQLNEPF